MAVPDKLLKEKSQVKELLSKVENSYRTAVITEKKYNEMKARLLRKLDDIESKIASNGNNGNSKPESANNPEKNNQKKKNSEKPEIKQETMEEEHPEEIVEQEKPKKPRKPRAKKPKTQEEIPKAEEITKEEIPEKRESAPENPVEKPDENSWQKKEIKDDKMEKESQTDSKPEAKAPEEGKDEKKKSSDDGAAGDFTAEAAAQFGPQEEVKDVEADKPKEDIKLELEKLKVLVEGMRDEKKAVQESLQNISESMGELRSMIFQSEGLAKELEMKEEKIAEEIGEIRPSEISKKFRKFDENFEKFQIYTEKSDAKFEDLSKKINSVHEMMKSAGGIENLSELNRQIGRKLEDFNEAMKYVERLASKTEKAFIEVNKNLEDFHVYKARQDNLEEAFKDMMKALDDINMKLDESATKKDFSSFSGEQMVLRKQMEEVMRMVPMLKIKIPEPIQKLGTEKEEIKALLDMLVGQQASGTISQAEYDKLKKANEAKLKKIEETIETEWKKLERLLESGEGIEEIGGPLPIPPESNRAPAQQAESKQEIQEQKAATAERAENEMSQQSNIEPAMQKPQEKSQAAAQPARIETKPQPAEKAVNIENSSDEHDKLKKEIEDMLKAHLKSIEEKLSRISPSEQCVEKPEEEKEMSSEQIEEILEKEVASVFEEQGTIEDFQEIVIEEIEPKKERAEEKAEKSIPIKIQEDKKLREFTKAEIKEIAPNYEKPAEKAEASSIQNEKELQKTNAGKEQNSPEEEIHVTSFKISSEGRDENVQNDPTYEHVTHSNEARKEKNTEEIVTNKNHKGILSRMFHKHPSEAAAEAEMLKQQMNQTSRNGASSENSAAESSRDEKPGEKAEIDDVITMLNDMEKKKPEDKETVALLERLKKAAEINPEVNDKKTEAQNSEKGKSFQLAKKIKEMM